eukprot:TRINITY_DN3834_c0_g1_i1.p1 TRINITY_DN3834_c0_g1~~TRINITY_DN3834_c0_g1_i1.p1  ORF type:complete len:806 (-),score=160.66 TRINITY_DN3834_c0_g1_i1:60-2477(-)
MQTTHCSTPLSLCLSRLAAALAGCARDASGTSAARMRALAQHTVRYEGEAGTAASRICAALDQLAAGLGVFRALHDAPAERLQQLFAWATAAENTRAPESAEQQLATLGLSWDAAVVVAHLTYLIDLCSGHWELMELIWSLPFDTSEELFCFQAVVPRIPAGHLHALRQLLVGLPASARDAALLAHLPLNQNYCSVYQPLAMLLLCSEEALMLVRDKLPQLAPTQLWQITHLHALIERCPGIEVRALFGQSVVLQPSCLSGVPMSKPFLTVWEQPHSQVKQNHCVGCPSVYVHGNLDSYSLSQLVVSVALVRLDTNSEMDNDAIVGNELVPVTVSRVAAFSNIKIQRSSLDVKGGLFCLRFRLLHCVGVSPKELFAVTSCPIDVSPLSLQPFPSQVPSLSEIIPCSGSISGATKVVILGSNFAASPSTRVKFGEVEVIADEVRGTGTLICETPPHVSGVVPVRVCNGLEQWSTDAVSFSFGPDEMCDDEADGPSGGGGSTIATYAETPYSNTACWGRCQAGAPAAAAAVTVVGHGFPLLHYLAVFNRPADAELAVVSGKPVDGTDAQGNTALHWAMSVGSLEMVTFLLSHGAQADIQNARGETPLHFGSHCGPQVASAAACCEAVLCHGADPHICCLTGQYPLHCAAHSGNAAVLRKLISHGHHLNLTDEYQETALHVAVTVGCRAAVKVLLAAGANPNVANCDGETPLHIAVAYGAKAKAIFELLVHYGASTCAVNNAGCTPLSLRPLPAASVLNPQQLPHRPAVVHVKAGDEMVARRAKGAAMRKAKGDAAGALGLVSPVSNV